MFKTLTVCPTTHQVTTTEGVESIYPPIDRIRWIDITKQDEQAISLLGSRFQFHALTLEDCLHFDQRPKFDAHSDYDFLVIHGYSINWEKLWESKALELHIFITKNAIITVHEEPMPILDLIWSRVSSDGRLATQGTDYLCYLIADGVIDTYFPQISEVELKLDDLEDRVLESAAEVELSEIFSFKRLLLDLRRILLPQRDVIGLLTRQTTERFSPRVEVYMRDVYDHALRLHGYVENARELVSNVRDAHLWAASQRTNEIMKRLTILSAIFLPLTFMTGFFGQNFTALPVESVRLFYGTLACCVVLPVFMMVYFIRSKWF